MIEFRNTWAKLQAPVLMVLGVVAVFWKLILTRQYTFMGAYDVACQVLPWLQVQVAALHHGSIALWNPYEWLGQSSIGQVQPAVASPFTFLLALAPLQNGQLNLFVVHVWFVSIHCITALFAYWLLLDLECGRGAAAIGGLLYATSGFIGNTDWPQHLAAGIWAPLVFLFLLRAFRGIAPRRNAAWAGVALGCSWLGGHHGPSLMLTFAVASVFLFYSLRRGRRLLGLQRIAIVLLICGAVSAVQTLPTLEYGHRSIRWTGSGILKWDQKVGFPEHQAGGLEPTDFIRIVLPEYTADFVNLFEGIVGLALAALALWVYFARREVRLFLMLGVAAVLYSMSRNNPLYGVLYSLCTLVEKTREPILAMSIFHLAVAMLAGFGAAFLLQQRNEFRIEKLQKLLLCFSAFAFSLFYLLAFFRPQVNGSVLNTDPRQLMSAMIALALAAVLQLAKLGHFDRRWIGLSLFALVLIEQGNEVGWGWMEKHETARLTFLRQLEDNADVARFLRSRPDPKRVELNKSDIEVNVGDWFGVDAMTAYTPSAPLAVIRLNWWQDRLSEMLGVNYTLSKTPIRAGQQDVFTGKSGLKVFFNPAAFPRTWIVHHVRGARDDDVGATLVREGKFDLRKEAVIIGAQPSVETCADTDRVLSIREERESVEIEASLNCKGLLIVSDNMYPGWRATVDGRAAPLWTVNTALRGVVLDRGTHTVLMRYRPASVYVGFVLTLIGISAAIFLHTRREPNGTDLTS